MSQIVTFHGEKQLLSKLSKPTSTGFHRIPPGLETFELAFEVTLEGLLFVAASLDGRRPHDGDSVLRKKHRNSWCHTPCDVFDQLCRLCRLCRLHDTRNFMMNRIDVFFMISSAVFGRNHWSKYAGYSWLFSYSMLFRSYSLTIPFSKKCIDSTFHKRCANVIAAFWPFPQPDCRRSLE